MKCVIQIKQVLENRRVNQAAANRLKIHEKIKNSTLVSYLLRSSRLLSCTTKEHSFFQKKNVNTQRKSCNTDKMRVNSLIK